MSKYCVLSTDSNPEYFNLLPLVCYSWNKIGYKPVVLVIGEIPKVVKQYCNAIFVDVPRTLGVKDSTMAQISRIFAGHFYNFNEDDILLTGDSDMCIGKDIFWEAGEIVSYGHDLTGYGEIPICFVKATAKKWKELMGALTIPDKAFSEVWEDYWSVDQQMLTNAAKAYGYDKITFVKRGNDSGNHGLPIGRWDRYKWENVPADIIDVHMKRNDWDAQLQVFKRLWPEDDSSFLQLFSLQHPVGNRGVYVDMKDMVKVSEEINIPISELISKIQEKLPQPQKFLDKILSEDKFNFLPDTGVWGSHRPLLYLALELTKDSLQPIGEFGAGRDSTPFLRSYCVSKQRIFLSYDSNKEWAGICESEFVDRWDKETLYDKNYSVAFVDCAPGEARKDIISKLKGKAEIIVAHDTELYGAGDYKMEPQLSKYKYRLNYNLTQGGAGCSIVSDTIDVTVFDGLMLGKYLLEK